MNFEPKTGLHELCCTLSAAGYNGSLYWIICGTLLAFIWSPFRPDSALTVDNVTNSALGVPG